MKKYNYRIRNYCFTSSNRIYFDEKQRLTRKNQHRCRKNASVSVKVASVKQKKLTDFVANGNLNQSKNLPSGKTGSN
jgi:hypothetical protein